MSDLIRPKIPEKKINRTDLKDITFDELNCYSFSPGHIFYFPKLGQPKKLLFAGEPILDSLVLKYHQKGVNSFSIESASDKENFTIINNLIENLSNAKTEIEKKKVRDEYLNWFEKIYWTGIESGNFLDLVLCLAKSLSFLPDSILQNILGQSVVVYCRGLQVAAITFSLALITGHYDFQFLRELYNVCLLLDYGLFKQGFSYNVLVALNKERSRGGDGLIYLAEIGAAQDEVQSFLHHPSIGSDELQKFLQENLKYPELGTLIYTHHELSDGTGFPLGLSEYEMMSIESLVAFVDHLIPVESYYYSLGDGTKLLKGWVEDIQNSDYGHKQSSQRLLKILEQCFMNKDAA